MLNNRATDLIPIYDSLGNQINELKLKEKIIPIPTKRGGFAESGLYYKGAGVVYRNHLIYKKEGGNEQNTIDEKVQIIGKTGLVYENLIACYPNLIGNFGIFNFRHQPIFSDMEGGCGIKEQNIVTNQKEFELSAIEEIEDVIPTGIDNHNIYVFRLKKLNGGINETIELLRYVLLNDWNTPWDKNLWKDIECYGYVRDVADWFKSGSFNHKLGTVYAMLNSIYRDDMNLYARLLFEIFGEYNFNKKMTLYYSAKIMEKFCKRYEQFEYEINIEQDNWFKILFLELISGKACCHLEDDEKWGWVREYYKKKILVKGGN